ncbi:Protein ltv1, partial [Dipsacomyces acuminosporus]
MVKKFIDKKHATTYKLVYRSQEDPLAFEEGGTDRVFVEVGRGRGSAKKNKGKSIDQTVQQSLKDLSLDGLDEDDLDRQAGQAALYGVYLDDRDYDYTKHLRTVGTGGGVLLEAPSASKDKSASGGIQFADMSDDEDMEESEAGPSKFAMPAELLPSSHRMNIKGEAFPTGIQPHMNPTVREALEALEDDDVD